MSRTLVVLILRHSVARNVEARGVGQVVHIEGVLHPVPLAEFGFLDQRCIGAFLEGLPEDVALPRREAGLEGIGSRDCAAHAAGRK
jgi:hypothetical protein